MASIVFMPHPRLETFFNGAFDEVVAAYSKSKGAPSAVAGGLREDGIRRAIEHCLPGVARLYQGEIIDPFGRQSGQLDGIVVHASSVAVATQPHESRVVLAEGAVAVIEAKSDLTSQWDEAISTWSKVSKLRRFEGQNVPGVVFGPLVGRSEAAIPFVVIGRNGWKKDETIKEKAIELFDAFGTDGAPLCMVVQFDPPGVAICTAEQGERQCYSEIYDNDNRGKTLASISSQLAGRAQRIASVPIYWHGYFG